jgi:ribose transport system substrate-binding protein
MTMRKAAAAVLGAVVALSLTACGEDGGAGGGGQPYIAIVSKGFQHRFWQAVKQGAEEEADKQGARVTFVGRRDGFLDWM